MAHALESYVHEVSVSLWRVTTDGRGALELAEGAHGSGRGHLAGEPSPLYGSETADTARAEFLNAHPFLAGAEVQFTHLTGRLAVIDVLAHEEAATSIGFTVDQLTANAWSACQAFCAQAFDHGAEAVRLPSTRDRPDGVNVIVSRAAAIDELVTERVELRRV